MPHTHNKQTSQGLRACPFCASAEIETSCGCDGYENWAYVRCAICGAGFREADYSEGGETSEQIQRRLLVAWNDRPIGVPVSASEKCRDLLERAASVLLELGAARTARGSGKSRASVEPVARATAMANEIRAALSPTKGGAK